MYVMYIIYMFIADLPMGFTGQICIYLTTWHVFVISLYSYELGLCVNFRVCVFVSLHAYDFGLRNHDDKDKLPFRGTEKPWFIRYMLS